MSALVIIPTHNEASSLPHVLARLRSSAHCDVLIVDDCSTDGTTQWVRRIVSEFPTIHLMERSHKLGLMSAYVAGFKWALARDYKHIIQMDGDLSHDPSIVPEFIHRSISGNDVVIGSRYLDGIRIMNWPFHRLMLSYGGSIYARFFTGLRLTDPTSGFKCFRREVLETIDLDNLWCSGYAFQIEMNYLSMKLGFNLCEIPITFFDRSHGVSKMNLSIAMEAIWKVPLLPLRDHK